MRHSGEVRGHARKNGGAPGQKHYYRRVWSFSKWDEFVVTRSVGTIAQVCTGGSGLGVVRLDADRKAPSVNVVANFRDLPLRDGSFDTVVCDPPYAIPYPDRVRLQRELARVARSRVILKAPWVMRAAGWKLADIVLLLSHTCANIAALTMMERSTAQGTLL
jgi:Methyltransferase domain